MSNMIIADNSEALCDVLSKRFSKEHRIQCCHDGIEVFRMLQQEIPDILILDFDLPNLDGLTILSLLGDHKPPIILGLGRFLDDYILQQAKDMGVGIMLRRPIKAQAIIHHINQLIVHMATQNHSHMDSQNQTSYHLIKLDIPLHRDGFQQLRVGIPLYAQDPRQSVCKDLYPAIAQICGNDNGKQVEKAVRNSIRYGWEHRDNSVWQQYFPNHTRTDPRCPSNKVFISNLAERIKIY